MLLRKAVHSDGNGGDGAPLLPRNGHMDGRRGQHPYRHIPGLLRLLHLHRDAGKLQPVPAARVHYGLYGSALPVRPVYVGAGQPSRPVSIVPLCGGVHGRSRGACRSRRRIWPTKPLPPFWRRPSSISAIPMYGVGTSPAHPLIAPKLRVLCLQSMRLGLWAVGGAGAGQHQPPHQLTPPRRSGVLHRDL